ncbi:L-glyceraldehyde 3-phosphate reductase [Streptomyces tanashiensis]
MTDSPLYRASADRYEAMEYRRTGRSGLRLPAISLGLWHNFGDDKALDTQRAILRRAFDLGVTHFDLANNYGPPPGSPSSTSASSSPRTSRPTATS